MKLIFFLLLFIATQSTFAQIKFSKLDSKYLPKSIKYKGRLNTSFSYTDKEGKHILITSNDSVFKYFYRISDLYVYNYIITGKITKLEWQIHEMIAPCQKDGLAEFVMQNLSISDINKNSLAEVWFLFTSKCTDDANPRTMKIIMHESKAKYEAIGTDRVRVDSTNYIGGNYTFDPEFTALPPIFKNYARKLWKNNQPDM